jgi:cyclophilin family peptidyl-prolyl cis-trans isomerase
MIRTAMVGALMVASAAIVSTTMASAQAPAPPPAPAPAPSEIVAAAPASDWVGIAADDLIVMTLTPDPRGGAGRTGDRRVVMQLMPAPFSQGWVGNIRTLARARWWDGLAIVRVQDNYVTQWGDPDGEDAAKARALPVGLRVMAENEYVVPQMVAVETGILDETVSFWRQFYDLFQSREGMQQFMGPDGQLTSRRMPVFGWDNYGGSFHFFRGWPLSMTAREGAPSNYAPVHCYGMVGVGRNLSPDTGTGAALYTVIGHAPRHLDRNIALVGRVIEGMEHLSSLPRGTGPLGFYESAEERTGITSIRLASELPAGEQPSFEYLSTTSETFARYAEARANRRDPFFNVPVGGADVCNIPVPVRRAQSPR